ncbi:hypothetical protein Tco_0815213 [Tanacetum coccineum]
MVPLNKKFTMDEFYVGDAAHISGVPRTRDIYQHATLSEGLPEEDIRDGSYDLMAVVVKVEAEEEEEGDLITVVNEMKISWWFGCVVEIRRPEECGINAELGKLMMSLGTRSLSMGNLAALIIDVVGYSLAMMTSITNGELFHGVPRLAR